MKNYSKSSHTLYHHRYHIVWITKYRYAVLQGEVQSRVRDIVAQVSDQLHVKIVKGVVSKDHVHLLCSIPPHISVSDYVQRVKGKSSRVIQQEFSHIRRRYWGRHFWGRGYFSSTSGNVTDEIIQAYIENHTDANKSDNSNNISLE